MKKLKKTFKRIGSVFAVLLLILIMTILPTLALSINVTINYVGAGGYSAGIYFKTSDSVDYTNYQEGATIVAYADYSAQAYISLTQEALNMGYTGFLLYLTESKYYVSDQNLVPTYLQESYISLADGTFYVASGDVFLFYKDTMDLFLTAVPVNYDNYITSIANSEFERGRRQGMADQQGRINELESTLAVLTDEGTSRLDAYWDGVTDGYNLSDANQQYVKDVAVTIVDGTGSIIEQLLNLQILGISLYQIALLACAIPFTIFLVKICIHH